MEKSSKTGKACGGKMPCNRGRKSEGKEGSVAKKAVKKAAEKKEGKASSSKARKSSSKSDMKRKSSKGK